MFDFGILLHPILVQNIRQIEAETKYTDKVMIAVNTQQATNDGEICGDIVAFLTPAEYTKLNIPRNAVQHFRVWEGDSVKLERLGVYGTKL